MNATAISQPELLPTTLVVDSDLDPKTPISLSLIGEGSEHRKMGNVVLEKRADGNLYANGVKVIRHISPNQQNGKTIQGHRLRKELEGKQILNACFLDALFANKEFIPEEWKTGVTYFFATVFADVAGKLCVKCLSWDGEWHWSYGWLANEWLAEEYAACLEDLPMAA
jgi:hypothetical protein